MHRLNRTEYGNAIRDLLGLHDRRRHAAAARRSRRGFDNVAASLALVAGASRALPGRGARDQPAGRRRSHARRGRRARPPTACRDCSSRTCGWATICRSARAAALAVRHDLSARRRIRASRFACAARSTTTSSGWATRRNSICGSTARASSDSRVGGEATGTPGPLTWNGEIVGDTPYELYMHAADADLEVRDAGDRRPAHGERVVRRHARGSPKASRSRCRWTSAAGPTSSTTAVPPSMRSRSTGRITPAAPATRRAGAPSSRAGRPRRGGAIAPARGRS